MYMCIPPGVVDPIIDTLRLPGMVCSLCLPILKQTNK